LDESLCEGVEFDRELEASTGKADESKVLSATCNSSESGDDKTEAASVVNNTPDGEEKKRDTVTESANV